MSWYICTGPDRRFLVQAPNVAEADRICRRWHGRPVRIRTVEATVDAVVALLPDVEVLRD